MRAKPVTDGHGERYARFDCPGCAAPHVIPVTGSKAWGFNGSFERPTLTPSILVQGRNWNEERQTYDVSCCHSFVTDGRIQFLGDCTHALAGQTVDLPEIADS